MVSERSIDLKSDTTKSCFAEVDRLITNWLKERQSLIILMCAVDGLREFTPETASLEVKVQAFCVLLMDYMSAGHFEVYGKLIHEAQEFGDNQFKLVKELYPKINYSTELALLFNDKYVSAESCVKNKADVGKDMSKLAEALEERFRYEDTLIDVLHGSHRDQVA